MWIYELRINAADPNGSAKELYEAIRYWPQLGIVSIVDDHIVAVFEGATQNICRNIVERLRNQRGSKVSKYARLSRTNKFPARSVANHSGNA